MTNLVEELESIAVGWESLVGLPIGGAVSEPLEGSRADEVWHEIRRGGMGSPVCVPPTWAPLVFDYTEVRLTSSTGGSEDVEALEETSFQDSYRRLLGRSPYSEVEVEELAERIRQAPLPEVETTRQPGPSRVVVLDCAPRDLPVWLSLGDVSGAPDDLEHRAFLTHWDERYGVRLYACTETGLTMNVADPPQTAEALAELAGEQVVYCRDLTQLFNRPLEVGESPGDLDGWVDWFDVRAFMADRRSNRWAFWWD